MFSKRIIAGVLLCITSIYGYAQAGMPERNRIVFSVGAAPDYSGIVGVAYMIEVNPWLEIGLGLYVDGNEYPGESTFGGSFAESSETCGMQINPFLRFRTPALFSIGEVGASLYAEPGALYVHEIGFDTFRNASSKRSFALHGRGKGGIGWIGRSGVTFELDKYSLSIGAFVSDIYWRYLDGSGKIPGGMDISVGIRF